MPELASVHVVIHGYVQGVFFRAFVVEKANGLGLRGFTRNLPSKVDVEVEAEGNKEKLKKLIEYLKTGPPTAKVESIEISWAESTGKYNNFKIEY